MKREFNINEHMRTIMTAFALLVAGFLYPVIMDEWLTDILWNGEEWETYLFIAVGTAIFGIAGTFINKLVETYTGSKKIIVFKPKWFQTASNLFVGFGIDYNILIVYNEMKNYGVIGKYALKESGFSFFGPLAIIMMIVIIIELLYASIHIFYGTGKTTAKTEMMVEKHTRVDELEKTKSCVKESAEGENKIIIGDAPKSRIKSTMRTSSADIASEETDIFL